MGKPLEVGETVYLTPRTLGACAAAFLQPKATVVALPLPFVTVRLAVTGDEITTHENNLPLRLPQQREPVSSRQSRPSVRAGFIEVALFDLNDHDGCTGGDPQ